MIEHKDYFQEVIEPGDKVLRAIYSELQIETVTRLTPRAIYFERTDQWSIKKGLGPLRIAVTSWWSTEKHLIKLKKDSND